MYFVLFVDGNLVFLKAQNSNSKAVPYAVRFRGLQLYLSV